MPFQVYNLLGWVTVSRLTILLLLFAGRLLKTRDGNWAQEAYGLVQSRVTSAKPEDFAPEAHPRGGFPSTLLSALAAALHERSFQGAQAPSRGVFRVSESTGSLSSAIRRNTGAAAASVRPSPSEEQVSKTERGAEFVTTSQSTPPAKNASAPGGSSSGARDFSSAPPDHHAPERREFEPPFRLLSIYPAGTKSTFVLKGLQPLLAAFSLPVVPLGGAPVSDSDAPEKAAFSVQANNSLGTVPGRGYWLTPKVYRFEPFDPWPTDLRIVVQLNGSLLSLSGDAVDTADPYWIRNNVREFTTPRLVALVRAVTSKLASSFTDGRWSPTLSNSADPLSNHLEVPPDGQVIITFNSVIDIENLNDERLHLRLLAVSHTRSGGGTQEDQHYYVDYEARQCTEAEVDSLVSGGPDVAMRTADDQHRQRDEIVGCAVLSFTKDPLKSGQEYELLMKKKIRYNKLSGPTGQRKPVVLQPPDVKPQQTEYMQAASLASSSTSVFSRFLMSVGENPLEDAAGAQASNEENSEEDDIDSEWDGEDQSPEGDEDGGVEQTASTDPVDNSGVVYTEVTLNPRQFEKIGGESFGIQLTGLRPFMFYGTGSSSFRSTPTVRYRRLVLMLPHSLNGYQAPRQLWPRTHTGSRSTADDRSAKAVERLAEQLDLRVEGTGQTVNFTLHMQDSVTAVLATRDLRPGGSYVLSVRGTVMVRDKFNQPLQSSTLAFRMDKLQSVAKLIMPRDSRVWFIDDSYLRSQLRDAAEVHMGTAVQFSGNGRSTSASSSNEDMEVRQVIANNFRECLLSHPEACLASLFDNVTSNRENYHGRSVTEVTPSWIFPHPLLVYAFENRASRLSGSLNTTIVRPLLFHKFATASLFLVTVKSKDPIQLYTSTSNFLWGVLRLLVRVTPTVMPEAGKSPAFLVQVLDLETAYPLNRSTVSVYGKTPGDPVVSLGVGTTDVRGFALVPIAKPEVTTKLILVVAHERQTAPYVSEIIDAPSVWFSSNTGGSTPGASIDLSPVVLRLRNGGIILQNDLSFVLLSDRTTYRRGESIHLYGFLSLMVESWNSGLRATTLIHDAYGLNPGDLKVWLQLTWQDPEGPKGAALGPGREDSRDARITERAPGDNAKKRSRSARSSSSRNYMRDGTMCSNAVVSLDEFGNFIASMKVPIHVEHGQRAVIEVGVFEQGMLHEEAALVAGSCTIRPESVAQTETVVQPRVLSGPNIVVFAPKRTAVFLSEVSVPPIVRYNDELLVKGLVKNYDGLYLNGQQVRVRFSFEVPTFLRTRFGRKSSWWTVKTRQPAASASVVSRDAGWVCIETVAWSNASGSFEVRLDLADVVWMADDRKANRLRLPPGTSISVEVECQRQQTEQGTSYKETTIVANTPFSIGAFDVSMTPLLPGVPFTVTTNVIPRPRVKTPEQFGRKVLLQVFRVNPEISLPLPEGTNWEDWVMNPGLTRCPMGDMPLAADGTIEVRELEKLEGISLVQRCDAKRPCYVKLPVDAAQYLFIATLIDKTMGRETHCEFFQANQRTLSSHHLSLQVRPHKRTYAAGDSVRLRFLNPFTEGSAIRPVTAKTRTSTGSESVGTTGSEMIEANVSVVWNTKSLRRHSRMVTFRKMDAVEISVGRVPEECLTVCAFTLFITMPISSEPLPLMQLNLGQNRLYPSTTLPRNPVALNFGPFVVEQEVKVVVSHPVRELQVPAGAVDLRLLDSRGEPGNTFDGKERITVQVTVHKGKLRLERFLKNPGIAQSANSSSWQRGSISLQSAKRFSPTFATRTSLTSESAIPQEGGDIEEENEYVDVPLSVKGQVVLTMVDKRFLDVRSAPLFHLAEQLEKRATVGVNAGAGTMFLKWSSSLEQACSYDGFRFINEVKQRRQAADPWLDVLPWPLLPRLFFNSTYSKEYLEDTVVYDRYAWSLTGHFRPKQADSLHKVRMSQRGLFMTAWEKALSQEPAQEEVQNNNGEWDITPDAPSGASSENEREDMDMLEAGRSLHREGRGADYEIQFLPRTEPIIGWQVVELVDTGRGLLRGTFEVELPNEATAHVVRGYTVLRVNAQEEALKSDEIAPGRPRGESDSAARGGVAAKNGTRRDMLVSGRSSDGAEAGGRERRSGTVLMLDSREKVFQIRKSVAAHAYAPSTLRSQDVALVGVTLDVGSSLIGKGVVVKLVSTSLLTPLTSLTPRTQHVYIAGQTQEVLFHVAADRGLGRAQATFAVALEASSTRVASPVDSISEWFSLSSLPALSTASESSGSKSSLKVDKSERSKRRFKRVSTVQVTIEVLPSLRRMNTASFYPFEARNISLDNPEVVHLLRNANVGAPLPYPVMPDVGAFRLAAGTSCLSAILFKLRELIRTRLTVHRENRGLDRLQRSYNGSDLLIILFGEALMRKAYHFEDSEVSAAAERARSLLPAFYSGDSSRGFLSAPADTLQGAKAPLSIILTMLAVFVADADVTASLQQQRKKFVTSVNRYIRLLATRWNQDNGGLTLLQYIGPELIGIIRFVLGSSHRFGLDVEAEQALSTASLLPPAQAAREDLCDKLPSHVLWALLVMKRETHTTGTHPVELRCIHAMRRLFRRQGSKGYIALDAVTNEPNTNTVHSLVLLLLTSSRQWTEDYAMEIRTIMTFLYGGGRKPPRSFMVPGLSRWSLVLLLVALEQWDRQLGNMADQSMMVEVQAREPSEIDGVPLIDGFFDSDHRGPVERSLGWSELEKRIASRRDEKLRGLFPNEAPAKKAGIAALAVGKGVAFVSTFYDFVPLRSVVFPTYEGCLVQKRYHLLDSQRGYCKPDSTLVVNSGDRVCVSITVTFKSPAKLMTLRDWLPAGLQPLDDAAEGFSPHSLTLIQSDQKTDDAVTPSLLEGRCKKHVRGQALEWVCESLSPGTYSFAVLTSANFPGFFEVSLSTAFVFVPLRPPAAGEQADRRNVSRTLQGTSGAAHKAFAILPMKKGTEKGRLAQADPFTAAGLPTPPVWFLDSRPKSCPPCEFGTVCSPALGTCVPGEL
ncbi:hypothetical protein TGME49_288000 [Toxoplasma gondii ME49]|uniref:Bacterial alpha-2-macroglobulin MG10 domain-containing protein n=1 Tax=Toxoplasma gondii (strain ATCC 50611 / Me49) TaxID=508771 RepID=S8EWM8_TOXGM|nr:hypothetical protein TGME49_288000 [Toxoplasma gondii ME49]EPT27816.1 hypothetical protein TGME49_288000 [Toxoplasma gondii ME49]|eukprot:XP_018636341.1 hypothetical protein TGME49_288000 [Toxoplasma gondii ME49]